MRCEGKYWLAALAILSFCSCARGADVSTMVELVEKYILALMEYENDLELLSSVNRTKISPELLAEFYIHGNGHSSFVLSSLSNFVQYLAISYNARTLDDFKALGIQQLTQEIESRIYNVCPASYIDCSDLDLTYRQISGVCNNLQYPAWGAAKTAQSRLIRPRWENVAVVTSTFADAPDSCSSLDELGVRPDKGHFVFHLSGNGPVSLHFLQEDTVCDIIKCSEKCSVNGIIVSVHPVRPRPCNHYDIHASAVALDAKRCKRTYKFSICYHPIAAKVELSPKPGTVSTLSVNGKTVDKYSPEDRLFPGIGEGQKAPFSVHVGDDKIAICRGCECTSDNTILSGKLKEQSVDVCFDPQGSEVLAQFPVENNLILETQDGRVRNLNDVRYIYEQYHRLRFGLQGNSGEIIIKNSYGQEVCTLWFQRNKLRVSILEEGDSYYETDVKFNYDAVEDFEDGRGEVHEDFKAIWIVWVSNVLFIGDGNLVGKNLWGIKFSYIQGVDTIELTSDRVARWIFDIELVNVPRMTSSCGLPLSSARDVSLLVHSDDGQATVPSPKFTKLLFQFGQFLDHDFILTPQESMNGDEPIHCVDNFVPLEEQSVFCFNIPITDRTDLAGSQGSFPSDQFQVLPFVRSASMLQCGQYDDLRLRYNQNLITSFVDATNVYASSEEEARVLRDGYTGEGARLAVEDGELPETASEAGGGEGACNNLDHGLNCRLAGDIRSNEQPALLAMHTVWVREHNRIVDELVSHGNPEGTDEEKETLYQKARRLLIAEMQVVVYDGFLKTILDRRIIDQFRLGKGQCKYDPSQNPSANSETGICYRFGHTMIPKIISSVTDTSTGSAMSLLLENNFFNPEPSYVHGADNVLRSYPSSSCPHIDRVLEEVATDELFSNINGNPTGTDLAALNVQRGRDHGMPSYCSLRRHFNLQVPKTFDDLLTFDIMSDAVVSRLKEVYDSVCDLDLFTAVISEKPLSDKDNSDSASPLGELLNYVLAEFFGRVKCGDRYWYEFSDAGFTKDQINHVHEVSTLSRILCDNTNITAIQPDAFHLPNKKNKVQPCSYYPPLKIQLLDHASGGVQSQQRSMMEEEQLKKLLNILEELKEMDEGGEK